MKTLIAIPCTEHVSRDFFQSALNLRVPGETHWATFSSSLVYESRSNLAHVAMEGGYDRVLWLDSDISFDEDLAERLAADMDQGLDYVCALVFTRRGLAKPAIYSDLGYFKHESGKTASYAKTFLDYPRDSLFRVEASGMAACMMSVDVIRRVAEAYDYLGVFSPLPGNFGEDLSFCMRLKELGIEMYCDSRIKCGHEGYYTVNEEVFDAQVAAGMFDEDMPKIGRASCRERV